MSGALTTGFSRRTMLLMTAGLTSAAALEWPLNATGGMRDGGAAAEHAAKAIPSIALALVDRTGTIHTETAGFSDAKGQVPAGGRTAYRLGSFAGLFSELTILRLVREGYVRLDAPIGDYLPELRGHPDTLGRISVGDLLHHRSGLPRELHHDSLDGAGFVALPARMRKYSNADRQLLDRVIARVTGMPIEQAQAERLFRPAGMTDTALDIGNPSGSSAIVAPFDAPRFAPPTAAGSWISTIDDLAALARTMLKDARSTAGLGDHGSPPLDTGYRPLTLGSQRGFAYAGGAPGHTAHLAMLPESGLAAIALLAIDNAPVVAERLAMHALGGGLSRQTGRDAAAYPVTTPVSPDYARRAAGTYRAGDAVVTLRTLNGRLYLESGTIRGEVRRRGADHVVDDLTAWSDALAIAPDFGRVSLGDRHFDRTRIAFPPPAAPEFEALIGDYGADYDHIRIYERGGHAFALVNGSSQEPLSRIDADTYAFSATSGLHRLETLHFSREPSGRGRSISLSGTELPRRDFGLEMDDRTRAMARFADTLRTDALAATPPVEKRERQSDLVELAAMVPAIRLDMRYATTENFMGIPFYEAKRAFLQRPAAEAVARAQKTLMAAGYGLAVHDAYRPWYVTRMFWDAMPQEGRIFLADPAEGSRHNRGCAIDVTLYDLATGQNVVMPGAVDEVSSHSSPLYLGGTSRQRWLRDLLKDSMEAEGFTVDAYEWWHFDHPDWPKYPILNTPFDRITGHG